ncbi:hypothetical protein K504DRAFT_343782, partial [Pleomassaria siparia CBS 279.74]
VHQEPICKSSPFFKAALGRNWAEKQDGIVRLPTHSAKTFQVYNQWLYRRWIYPPATGDWPCLVDAYLLGEYLQDMNFTDTIMDTMLTLLGRVSLEAYKDIQKIYNNTKYGSPLRRLVVDLTVWRKGHIAWASEEMTQWPTEFVQSMALGLSKRIEYSETMRHFRDPTNNGISSCRYHCHGEE